MRDDETMNNATHDAQPGYANQGAGGWWANTWLDSVTEGMPSARVANAKQMYEAGAVAQLHLLSVGALAIVDDPQSDPCQVRISFLRWSDPDWTTIVDVLSEQAIYVAQLLNGGLSPMLERILNERSVSLFPRRNQMSAQCTCDAHESWGAHALATVHAIASRIGHDPFALFQLRGYERDDLVMALRDRRLANGVERQTQSFEANIADPSEQDLSQLLDSFWEIGDDIADLRIHVSEPEVDMELVKVLGEPSFAAGTSLRKRLAEMYSLVTQRALRLAYGLDEPPDEEVDD